MAWICQLQDSDDKSFWILCLKRLILAAMCGFVRSYRYYRNNESHHMWTFYRWRTFSFSSTSVNEVYSLIGFAGNVFVFDVKENRINKLTTYILSDSANCTPQSKTPEIPIPRSNITGTLFSMWSLERSPNVKGTSTLSKQNSVYSMYSC